MVQELKRLYRPSRIEGEEIIKNIENKNVIIKHYKRDEKNDLWYIITIRTPEYRFFDTSIEEQENKTDREKEGDLSFIVSLVEGPYFFKYKDNSYICRTLSNEEEDFDFINDIDYYDLYC